MTHIVPRSSVALKRKLTVLEALQRLQYSPITIYTQKEVAYIIEFAAEGSVSHAVAKKAGIEAIRRDLFGISGKFRLHCVTGMVLSVADLKFDGVLVDRLGLSLDHAARVGILLQGFLLELQARIDSRGNRPNRSVALIPDEPGRADPSVTDQDTLGEAERDAESSTGESCMEERAGTFRFQAQKVCMI